MVKLKIEAEASEDGHGDYFFVVQALRYAADDEHDGLTMRSHHMITYLCC